jgi:WD40 repeat protein
MAPSLRTAPYPRLDPKDESQKTATSPAKADTENADPLGPLLDLPPDRQPSKDGSWRPKGVLIAHLQEHTKAINRLAVARDNVFFASGSDDGTVRIWDCRRLERDVSFRSKLTYDTGEGRVTGVEMLDGYDVAAATSGGSIHVARCGL